MKGCNSLPLARSPSPRSPLSLAELQVHLHMYCSRSDFEMHATALGISGKNEISVSLSGRRNQKQKANHNPFGCCSAAVFWWQNAINCGQGVRANASAHRLSEPHSLNLLFFNIYYYFIIIIGGAVCVLSLNACWVCYDFLRDPVFLFKRAPRVSAK